jgi:polar amino acid transport system substrate-binding protein
MKFFRTLFLIIATFTLSQNLYAGSSNKGLLHDIQKKGEIVVGVSILPPWVMKNKKGELIGFEIDIAKQLASDMGVKVRFKQYQWSKMISALRKGDVDIIASGLSITPKRALIIDFSTPYSDSGYTLVSCLSLTEGFTNIKDLNHKEVQIAAVKGMVSADLVKRVFPRAQLILKKTKKEAAAAVVKGKVHAFVSSSPVPEFIALQHPDQVDLPLKNPLLSTKEAFAVRKNNQQMLNFLNAWVIAHEADNWIESSHEYWFNSLKWQRQVAK